MDIHDANSRWKIRIRRIVIAILSYQYPPFSLHSVLAAMEAIGSHSRLGAAIGEERETMETDTPLDHVGDPRQPTIPEDEFGSGTLDSAYQPQVWRDVGKLFQQETLSDVMLMAEGQSIPCHKFLLATASEYLYDKLVHASDTVNHNLLELKDINFQTLKVIVSYLYTGHINITVQNAPDVISACKDLKLRSAYETCEAYLMEEIGPANCIGLCKVATVNDIQRLKEKAVNIMCSDFKEVVSGPEFLNMSADEVEEYIQNESLRIPNEDPVYDAVISWIEKNPEDRASAFSQLISSVRFRFCSAYCLKHIVPKESLMETLEHQRILISAMKHKDTESVCWDNVGGDCVDCSVLPRKGYQSKPSMLIIGGFSDTGDADRRECWHMQNEEWNVLEKSPMPTPIRVFSACTVTDGIVVSGGFSKGTSVSQCWLLSTLTYQWSPLPDLNTARCRHASVCVGGQVYVIGGAGVDNKEMSSVEVLQKKQRQFECLKDIPKALVHAMVLGYRQCIYVFGGADMKWNQSKCCYAYDTKCKFWQKLSDIPVACEFGSVVEYNGILYLVGGFKRSCMCFNPLLNVWTRLSQCKHEHGDAPVLVWKDRLLVCGGRSTEAQRADGKPGGTSVIEEYEPRTDTWTVSQIELPRKLSSHFVFSTEQSV